jgi:hypothetical protein
MYATSEIARIAPSLVNSFVTVINFLAENHTLLPNPRGNMELWSQQHISAMASKFAAARMPHQPTPPTTIPDPIVSFILNVYFGLPDADLERAKHEHKLAMAAENMVGDLLERFLASILEPKGWVWCAGSTVKSVDFVKPTKNPKGWFALQVKNRDNSENSSSSAIRAGTIIKKWHRTYSRTGKTNWHNFPDEPLRANLSEEEFQAFVKSYLEALKTV